MNKQIRNIIIFAFFTVGGGWLGIWLNNVTGNTSPPMQSLGALVWLTSPAVVCYCALSAAMAGRMPAFD